MSQVVFKEMVEWLRNTAKPGTLALFNLIRDANKQERNNISDIYPKYVEVFIIWEGLGTAEFLRKYDPPKD